MADMNANKAGQMQTPPGAYDTRRVVDFTQALGKQIEGELPVAEGPSTKEATPKTNTGPDNGPGPGGGGLGVYVVLTPNSDHYDKGNASVDFFLKALEGDDYVRTGSGNDYIQAGMGSDEIHAGSGNDTIFGTNNIDSAYIGSSNDHDVLYGDAGNDRIWGSNGSDTLDGGTGNDELYGGAGGDTLNGGEGDDWIIDTYGNNTFNGGLGNDNMQGVGTFDGGEGNDTLIGRGNSILSGGAGNDKLTSAAYMPHPDGNPNWSNAPGNNILNGGAGADTITATHSTDRVVYSSSSDSTPGGGEDKVTIRNGAKIDLTAMAGELPAGVTAQWVTAFTGAPGEFMLTDLGNGKYRLEGNTAGGSAPNFAVQITSQSYPLNPDGSSGGVLGPPPPIDASQILLP